MSSNENQPVNILLVDDQPSKLLSYQAVVGELGENLLTATSAREALDVLLRNEIAVLLVDVCMPEMDGFDLLRLVRQHPRFRETAIILISSIQVSSLDHLRGYDSGAVDYVPVPFVPELLRAKVRVFADLYRKTRQLQYLNRRLEQLVEERTAELKRSNEDLEQFAYAASHDLQEPLRMVSSFVQLLSERYRGKLDRDADEFIQFAVTGAQRMHEMINDLLTYARVDTTDAHFGPVDCGAALRHAIEDLRLAIRENGAVISHSSLPTVQGDEVQIAQVFQNLIGNAIKFRRVDVPPQIKIAVERDGDDWIFSVEDNGIGIESVYLQRIFQVFQRLHGREEHPGTGIGLSLCKKIVERHHGRIWAESTPGEGSVFRFRIPATEEQPTSKSEPTTAAVPQEELHAAGSP